MANRGFVVLAAALGCALGVAWHLHAPKIMNSTTSKRHIASSGTDSIPDFALLDHRGVIHILSREVDAKAVVLLAHCNGCALLPPSSSSLDELSLHFGLSGVVFWLINTQDSRTELISEADRSRIDWPILMDTSAIVTRALGLRRSGDAVVIEPRTRKILYRGSLDVGALTAVLKGEAPTPAPPPAEARILKTITPSEISYNAHIAPLINKRCLFCHGAGGPYLPVLNSYEKLKTWSAMIRETLFSDRMPPFSVDDFYGKYQNDISLRPREKSALVEWIDHGLPRDPDKPDPLPLFKTGSEGQKQLGNEVYQASMIKEAAIPPGGTVEYQYFQLGGPIPEDYWVHSVYVESTSPRQLHHESLMIVSHPLSYYDSKARQRRDDAAARANTDGDVPLYMLNSLLPYEQKTNPNFLRFQVWAAGRQQPMHVPGDGAVFLPKGHYLVLETHYMGTGKPDKERTTIHFYGQPAKNGSRQLHSLMLTQLSLAIPPGTKSYVAKTTPFVAREKMFINILLGHMHMRGRSIKLFKTDNAGHTSTLISIPNYYYGWQVGASMIPEHPIEIEPGDRLQGVCEFDNSKANPNNPNPDKLVHFGQTVDRTEMCLFHIGYISN